ncbi:MAG: hypothetical protein IJB86_07520 [Clostridia bacterium]|nr:hypothetical protein [Clostridia bacterium]
MRKTVKKGLQRVFAVTVLLSLIFGLFGCNGADGVIPTAEVVRIEGEIKEQISDVRDRSLHLVNPETLANSMASSGLMEIFLDDNSFGIALFEKTKQKYWYSLPTKANANYDYSAATVTIDVLCGNTLYKLNSQDDSVAYGNISCEVLGDAKRTGFTVTYIITSDQETAKKITSEQVINETIPDNAFEKNDIVFEIKVTYELLDGNLYVSAQHRNLSGNENAYLLNMSLLPFFGASDTAESGDFILVPDGCGAVINTSVDDTAFKPLSFAVYGDNLSNGINSACFPAFGAKQGNNAFAVIIEDGDAVSAINVDRKNGKSGFNTVGTSFCITEYETVDSNGKTVTYVNKNSYNGELRLCIRLLGGASSGYDGLAAACREQFMRTGYISFNTVEKEQYLPFNLSVIGAATGVGEYLDFIETVKTLTTFEEAQDMLFRAKSKGINNINVRYVGALKSGANQTQTGDLSFGLRLGGKRGFKKLHEFTVAQGHNLFVDTAVYSWDSQKLIAPSKAISVNGSALKTEIPSAVGSVLGIEKYTRNFLSLVLLEDNIISLLNSAKKVSFDGFCVSDASKLLYSDYSKGYTDRQTAMQTVKDNLRPLSTDRPLMIDSCNLYAMKYADIVFNMPVSTSVAERDGLYESVPFLQMILHGTVDYSGTAINLADNRTAHKLKLVEYGACPSYEWCFSEKGTDKYCFTEQLNEAALYYTKANEVLSDLRDARIIDNGDTDTEGVRFTEYDTGAIIYVNYNDKAAKINNITIEANSFIRIG